MSNEYEMQRSASNPNLVVPGTGHVSASYAEQRAAGINYNNVWASLGVPLDMTRVQQWDGDCGGAILHPYL